MQYRKFGKQDLLVSEIGLGCEHLQGQDTAAVVQVVEAAMESGINILDCFMSEPQVRSDLGLALAGNRERMMIQGHLRSVWKDGQYGRPLDIDETRRAFEDLLERLKTDFIDFGLIHMVDRRQDLLEILDGPIMAYALSLKRQGVIRHLGISSHNSAVALQAAETGLLDCMMISVNPAYDMLHPAQMRLRPSRDDMDSRSVRGMDSDRAQLYRTCERMGIAITTMKTLGAGILLRPELSPFGQAMTDYQCVAYALDRPAVASAMLGMKTTEEVCRAAAYDRAAPEERDYTGILRMAPQYHENGACVYCNHCLPCPAGLDIARVSQYLDLVPEGGAVPPTVQAHYESLSPTASACIGCGSCEAACPFGVPVRQRMERAARLFGK